MIADHSSRSLGDLWSLSGRRAVVTGAAQGIGARIALRLAEAGASVLLADLDAELAATTAAGIAWATGSTTDATFIDISDTASIVTAAGRAVAAWGGLDIWINNAGEPESLDPNKCADGNGGEIIWNTFAGLVQAHPATLEPMPEIATRWEVSPDRRTYTFHLRPSEWSDGTPLTAHDFVFSFRRLLDPRTASKYATNGHIFQGGAAISRGGAGRGTRPVR